MRIESTHMILLPNIFNISRWKGVCKHRIKSESEKFSDCSIPCALKTRIEDLSWFWISSTHAATLRRSLLCFWTPSMLYWFLIFLISCRFTRCSQLRNPSTLSRISSNILSTVTPSSSLEAINWRTAGGMVVVHQAVFHLSYLYSLFIVFKHCLTHVPDILYYNDTNYNYFQHCNNTRNNRPLLHTVPWCMQSSQFPLQSSILQEASEHRMVDYTLQNAVCKAIVGTILDSTRKRDTIAFWHTRSMQDWRT